MISEVSRWRDDSLRSIIRVPNKLHEAPNSMVGVLCLTLEHCTLSLRAGSKQFTSSIVDLSYI
jgi:hypothetical protein